MIQSSNRTKSPVTINDLAHPDGIAAGTGMLVKIPGTNNAKKFMKKIAVLLFLIVCLLPALSQNRFRFNNERFKIDSLKKLLPSLKDSGRIDCLNSLGDVYIVYKGIDTAQYYTALAFTESKKINYIHGMAEAKSIEAEIGENFSKSIEIDYEAIKLYRSTSNKKRLPETYFYLGYVLWPQSRFNEALENLEISQGLFKKYSDPAGAARAISTIAWVYEESGNYEKAFELGRKGLDMAIENKDDWLRRTQLTLIGVLFRDVEDHNTALFYLLQALENLKPREYKVGAYFRPVREIAEQYSLLQQYDSARYYYSCIDTSKQRALRFYLVSLGEYYFLQKEYTKALANLIRGLNYHKRLNDRNQVMITLVDLAKTHRALQNNTEALAYAREALIMAKQSGSKRVIRDACQILYSIYDKLKKTDSAYFYYSRFVTMNDSILTDKVKGKLAAFTFEQRIELLNKEKEIQLIQLQKQSLQRKILVGSIGILLLLTAIIFRGIMLARKNEKQKLEHQLELQRLESSETKTQLQQQATELEMQALRAQMNPHFIFNSLNSINRFILKKQSSEATGYLTKFSRLIRMILSSSANATVSLAEDLEALQLYLELESLRFEQEFNYKIECDSEIDTGFIQVPPMLLQPFVENAIWHGLMNLPDRWEREGHLWININQEDSMLICTITDNGIGRKKAAALNDKSRKHKSMGMKITESRIAMMQKMNGGGKSIEIRDLADPDGSAAGTEVVLRIPVEQLH